MSMSSSSRDIPRGGTPISDILNPAVPLPTGAIFNFRPVKWLRKDLSADTRETLEVLPDGQI